MELELKVVAVRYLALDVRATSEDGKTRVAMDWRVVRECFCLSFRQDLVQDDCKVVHFERG